jgi:hypothetical protein
MSDTDIEILAPVESKDESMAISLARAEIDQQISTAKAYPRSIEKAVKGITALALLDVETAQSCTYALPRGGKPITGPSARFAEIVFSQWGNARVSARVVHVDKTDKYIEAEGIFHDLETNTARRALVRRRISDKHGRVLSDDMITVTGNAAASIASRNAILAGIPKAAWGKAYDKCLAALRGDVKTLSVTRDEAMKNFAAFGVTPEQVFAALDVAGIADVTTDHIVTLRAMFATLKNGEATVEEMFPPAKTAKPSIAKGTKAPPPPPENGSTVAQQEDEAPTRAAAKVAVVRRVPPPPPPAE